MKKKFYFASIILIFISGFFLYPSKTDLILKNSELKDYNFNPEVVEIKAPKSNIKAYLFVDKTNPIVSIDVSFLRAGWAQNKIANILAPVLLDDENVQEQLELGGISISYSAGIDDFGVSVLSPKSSLVQALNLFKTSFYHPNIKNSSILKTKQQLLLLLKRQTEQPQSVLSLRFNKALYGNHPYASNPIGSEQQITKITQIDLQNFMQKAFAKDNIVVALAGDLSPLEAQEIIDDMFLSLPQHSSLKPLKSAKINKVNEWIEDNTAQNISVFATSGVERLDKDFYPLFIANHILGGSGLNSKLALAIREKEGLVYSIYSYLSQQDYSNLILFSFSSAPKNYKQARNLFEEEIKSFSITKKELVQAKDYLIASNNLRFASVADISSFLIYMQKQNLGLDFFNKRNEYINNTTLQQVNDVAKKYYDFNDFQTMTIGEKQ